VDPAEEVMVAYEGDTPVFATLVSTGKPGRATLEGLYPVWLKARHSVMRGEDYFVEEVPFVQYSDRAQGLHGAFWHDHFGERVTHGCVNLSMADAAWLFDWAPPAVPTGWRSMYPGRSGIPTLWVLVEGQRP
jgi:lipoprotein-anchoring transpeptidase ErfK/SrfK